MTTQRDRAADLSDQRAIRAALDAYQKGDERTARKLLGLAPGSPMPRSWVHCPVCGYPCCGGDNDEPCSYMHRRR